MHIDGLDIKNINLFFSFFGYFAAEFMLIVKKYPREFAPITFVCFVKIRL